MTCLLSDEYLNNYKLAFGLGLNDYLDDLILLSY